MLVNERGKWRRLKRRASWPLVFTFLLIFTGSGHTAISDHLMGLFFILMILFFLLRAYHFGVRERLNAIDFLLYFWWLFLCPEENINWEAILKAANNLARHSRERKKLWRFEVPMGKWNDWIIWPFTQRNRRSLCSEQERPWAMPLLKNTEWEQGDWFSILSSIIKS